MATVVGNDFEAVEGHAVPEGKRFLELDDLAGARRRLFRSVAALVETGPTAGTPLQGVGIVSWRDESELSDR